MAQMLRMDPRKIPDDRSPGLNFTSGLHRDRAILWILAHFVSYRM